MENSRNGDVKVTSEQVLFGQSTNGAFPTYLDLVQDAVDAGPERPLPPQSTGSRRRTYADGELDVFAAERYFKGAMDGNYKEAAAAAVVVPEETVATAARPAVAVSKPAWTTASADSTRSGASANSQTVLFRNARRRLPGYRGKQCCLQFGVLLRSCSGKRAVGVDSGAATEAAGSGEPAASRIEWYRGPGIEKAALGLAGDGNHGVVAGLPPNLNLGTAKVAAIGSEVIREEKAVEYTSASFRRSFTLLPPVKVSVPANGGGGVDTGVGRGGGNGDDDDVGSESSSDLFEIKSLMIDDCPYEPSEASIQWSVVTASAGDVSVASERGGRAGSAAGSVRLGPVAVRQHRDGPVGLLTGCVSHRAVDLSAMAAVRRFPPAPAVVVMRQRIDGFQKAQNGLS